jgi:hypothetical protein
MELQKPLKKLPANAVIDGELPRDEVDALLSDSPAGLLSFDVPAYR